MDNYQAIKAINAMRIIQSIETAEQWLAICSWVRGLKAQVAEEDWQNICKTMLRISMAIRIANGWVDDISPEMACIFF